MNNCRRLIEMKALAIKNCFRAPQTSVRGWFEMRWASKRHAVDVAPYLADWKSAIQKVGNLRYKNLRNGAIEWRLRSQLIISERQA